MIPTALSPMTATIPAYTQVYEDYVAGKGIPTEYRRDHALGTPEDVAALIVWLSSAESAGVTGQAIGIGGDRLTLYAHPAVLRTLDHDGGWTADAIDAAWAAELAPLAQTSGPREKG
ncbi:hypothetical protein ACQ143_05680 [Microbacterium sp. MC2]